MVEPDDDTQRSLYHCLPAEKYRKQCVSEETRYFIDSFHSRFVRFDSSVPNDETTRVINDDDLFSSDDRETTEDVLLLKL